MVIFAKKYEQLRVAYWNTLPCSVSHKRLP